jgi:hypothetical protein
MARIMPWKPDIAAKSAELYKQRAEPIRMRMDNIYLNSRGELRVKVSGKGGAGIVDLFLSDKDFRYEADDREVVSRFHRRF